MARLVAALVLLSTVILSGADLESEARALEAMLVAPCCFSQQVSVHQSPAADEVRRDVRARLAAGQTRQDILDAYVAKYGKHILAEPPAAGFDLTLYAIPIVGFLVSAAGLGIALRRFSRRRSAPASDEAATPIVPGSPDIEARLDDELRDLD